MPHPLVVHKRRKHDQYIGRPSKWGNPFTHRPEVKAKHPDLILVDTVEEAIYQYMLWLYDQDDLLADLHELRGKKLGCWCAPGPCHGDVLAALANDDEPPF